MGLQPLRSELPHRRADSKLTQLRANVEGQGVCVCVRARLKPVRYLSSIPHLLSSPRQVTYPL